MDTLTRWLLRVLAVVGPRDGHGDEGFTIIETMAAAVIGVVLIVAVVPPLRGGLTQWVTDIWTKISGA